MASMSSLTVAATALSAVNVALLAVLLAVWGRNLRTFRTPMVLGLVTFAFVLLVENVVAVYFFFSTAMLYSGAPGVDQAILVLRALQTVALLALTAVTLK